MFMWIQAIHVADTWDMLMKRALENNIMLVPGKAFMVDQVPLLNAVVRARFKKQKSKSDLPMYIHM
jgi:hypothetical protein